MSEPGVAVAIKSLSKTFRTPLDKSSGVKQHIVNFFSRQKGYREFQALHNVSFDIKQGEFFGIVGKNGSGKSTLLKTLAGIYSPDHGTVQVNGSLTPFIELGVGFNPELTGRENIFLNGALLGFSKREMEMMYNDIVDFAELGDFMEERLKNYSSGMQVRLAFSIAIRARSDILLLDEVLAVGDAIFQKKCYDYFRQLKKEKRTVIFVSHDVVALQEYCDRGVLINKGKVLYEGGIEKVVTRYMQLLTEEEFRRRDTIITNRDADAHIGTGEVNIDSTRVGSLERPQAKTFFTDEDKTLMVTLECEASETVEEPVYGITIFDAAGHRAFTSNNMWLQKKFPTIRKGEKVSVVWHIPNIFNTGTYVVTPALAKAGGAVTMDQIEEAASFKIHKQQRSNAYTNPPHDITITKTN
ncbi:MAG: ABC transporter ATP-binding protein [Acidobacteriota bacterium]